MKLSAVTIVGVLLCAGSARAHGGLVIPPARNNYNNSDPAEIVRHWTGGRRLGGPCAGSACLWFNEGCFNGCDTCIEGFPELPVAFNGTGQKNYYGVPNCANPVEPTLPEKYRTWNLGNKSAYGDYTRYHPWRAPGHAPTSDPCGIAGGYANETGGGGETPMGATQGAKGSELPPHPQVRTQWRAGGTAEGGWMVAANHGGGSFFPSFLLSPPCLCGAPSFVFGLPTHALHPMHLFIHFIARRRLPVLPLPQGGIDHRSVPRPDAARVRGQLPHHPVPGGAQGGYGTGH